MRLHGGGPAVSILVFGLSLSPLIIPTSGLAQETPEQLYQTALYQEEVRGDLRRAIDLFDRILIRFPDDRTVGAKAQLHIGLSYEKLGQQEAQQAYRQVIADFPEHTEEVAVARERLAELEEASREGPPSGPRFRKVEIPSRPPNGVLSPSGDSLAFVSLGSLWVVPLHSDVGADIPGEPVILAEDIGAWDSVNQLSWSADGNWIAVNAEDPEDPDVSQEGMTSHRAFVVPVEGGEPRILNMPERGSVAYNYSLSLSPKGRELAYVALPPGKDPEDTQGERKVFVKATSGGEPRALSSTPGRYPAISPDGKRVVFVSQNGRTLSMITSSNPDTTYSLTTMGRGLAGPIWSPDGDYIAVLWGDGREGLGTKILVCPLSHDRLSVEELIEIEIPRPSANLLAGWDAEGHLGVFMPTEVHQALYTVPASGGRAVQVSPELPAPRYPRWSGDGNRIYFRRVVGEEGEIPVVIGRIPASGGRVEEVPIHSSRPLITRFPGGGFRVSPDGGRILISAYQEPYDPKEGVDLWAIHLEGGIPTRLTADGSFEGYPAWAPSGEWIVFQDVDERAAVPETGPGLPFPAIFRMPVAGGEPDQLTSQRDSVHWGPISVSPDGKHIAFLSDGDLKTIPATGGMPEVLIENVSAGRRSDLQWSPDGSQIAYNGDGKIWIAPADGSGLPQELRTGLPGNARHGTFSWSPDGTRIAFNATIGGENELWLISDFLAEAGGRVERLQTSLPGLSREARLR